MNGLNLMNKKIMINQNRCSACGDCQEVCPQKILKIRRVSSDEKQEMTLFQRINCFYHKNNRLEVIDPIKCLGCGLCIKACRHEAIFLEDFKQLEKIF